MSTYVVGSSLLVSLKPDSRTISPLCISRLGALDQVNVKILVVLLFAFGMINKVRIAPPFPPLPTLYSASCYLLGGFSVRKRKCTASVGDTMPVDKLSE